MFKITKTRVLAVSIACCLGVALLWVPPIGRLLHPIKLMLLGRYTVEQRLEQYGPDARARLRPAFDQAGVAYPPAYVTLVGLKEERRLEVYAGVSSSELKYVSRYRIRGASGGPGPKLRRGDRQVPEGVYAVESLNPNSRFHLSIKVDYPNAFDREQAEADGRTDLGGDIFIHGGSASIGCLAMGDEAIEELFVLAADTGIEQVSIVLAPVDLWLHQLPNTLATQASLADRYARVKSALQMLNGESDAE